MTDYVPKITDFLQFKLTLGNLIEERLGDITREEREPLVDTTIYFRNGLASTNLQRQPHNVVPSHIIDRINNLLKSVNLAEVDDLLDFNGNLTWDGVHGDIYCRFAMEVAVVFEVSVWSVDPLGFVVKMHEKNTVPAPEFPTSSQLLTKQRRRCVLSNAFETMIAQAVTTIMMMMVE